MKKVALMVLGTAMQTYGEKLGDEQEVLLAAADIIDRHLRVRERGAPGDAGRQRPAPGSGAGVTSTTPPAAIEASAKTALAAMADGDTLRTLLAALRTAA